MRSEFKNDFVRMCVRVLPARYTFLTNLTTLGRKPGEISFGVNWHDP